MYYRWRGGRVAFGWMVLVRGDVGDVGDGGG